MPGHNCAFVKSTLCLAPVDVPLVFYRRLGTFEQLVNMKFTNPLSSTELQIALHCDDAYLTLHASISHFIISYRSHLYKMFAVLAFSRSFFMYIECATFLHR